VEKIIKKFFKKGVDNCLPLCYNKYVRRERKAPNERKEHKMTKNEIIKRLDALEAWDFELNQKEEWTEEEEEISKAIFAEMLELLRKLRKL
jgi:hypothetical protein